MLYEQIPQKKKKKTSEKIPQYKQKLITSAVYYILISLSQNVLLSFGDRKKNLTKLGM